MNDTYIIIVNNIFILTNTNTLFVCSNMLNLKI